MKSTERYTVHEQLGAGGMGVVYRATDAQRGEDVALKTIQKADDPSSIAGLKKEFRAFAGVNHRNLVSLYDLVTEGDQWFFTMELVRGTDFLAHVRGGAEDPAATPEARAEEARRRWSRLRAALVELARGIQAIHGARKLHCDIKPSNVMVDHNGRVVILDFGLVTDLAPEPWGRRASDGILGTTAYIAPEYLAGRNRMEASDWYSFGVLLYEALTGRPPFEGDVKQILRAKLEREPPAPRPVDKWAPKDLIELCAELLKREPGLRPSGPEIIECLTRRRKQRQDWEDPWAESVFVGRAEELAELGRAFEGVREGRAAMVLVRGPSGIGKSALVERFAGELRRRRRAVVLEGRCYEREAVPFKSLDRLVDSLTEHLLALPSEAIEALLPADIRLLARIFPPLKQLPSVDDDAAGGPAILDPQELRRRAFGALRELLRRLGERTPLVLLIDDLQWGDADSVGPLAHLFAPPSPPVALLITSFRDVDAETSPSLRALVDHWKRAPGECELRTLTLRPLADKEARELSAALLGSNAASGAAAIGSLSDAIAVEAEGSPYIVQELARHARLSGPSKRSAARSAGLSHFVFERLAALGDEERRLMEVIAIAGHPLRERAALRAADVSSAAAVWTLRSAHLLLARPSEDATLLEPYHDRIRAAIAEALPVDVRRARHLALAQALEALPGADSQLLVEHYREAGDAARASAHAITAADRAMEALAFNRAAELYRSALALGAPRPRWVELHAKIGEAQANAGRSRAAAESFSKAADELARSAPSDRRELDLRRRAGEQYLRCGYINEGIAILKRVFAAVDVSYPDSPLAAYTSLGLSRARLSAETGLRTWGLRRKRSRRMTEDEQVKLETFYAAGLGLALVDNIRAAHFQTCYELLALDTGDPVHVARSLATEVAFLAAEGGAENRARYRKGLRAAAALSERADNPYIAMLARLCAGVAAYYRGGWSEAAADLAEATKIGRERCTGVTWEMNCAEQAGLCSLAYLGEIRELRALLPKLAREAQERDDALALACMGLGLPNMALLAEGQPDKAEEQARLAMSRWTPQGFTSQHYLEVVARAQIELYRGDGVRAHWRLQEAWPKLQRALLLRLQGVRVELLHLRARAALAAAEERVAGRAGRSSDLDPQKLLELAEADGAKLEGEDMPCAAAFAALIRAGARALRRNADGARRALDAAAVRCSQLDMGLYAAAARLRGGALTGGDAGRAAKDGALAWMRGQEIADPFAMAAMLVPGFGASARAP